MAQYARGASREREVKALLEAQGYVVIRGAGSKGADLVALRAGDAPVLVEVKATKAPFSGFPPAERLALHELANRAGATALLCWWPPDRKGPRWFGPGKWPKVRSDTRTG